MSNKINFNTTEIQVITDAISKFPNFEDFDLLLHFLMNYPCFSENYEKYDQAKMYISEKYFSEGGVKNSTSKEEKLFTIENQIHYPAWTSACMNKYKMYNKELILKFDDKLKVATIVQNMQNYQLIIRKLYPNLRFSLFDRRCYLGNEPIDQDLISKIEIAVTIFLQGPNVKTDDIEKAVRYVAKENEFNPLQEYFENLPKPTGKNYLDNYLFDLCGVEKNELNRIIGRKWLISAVARAIQPGCYVEGALIFTGQQAAGKTFFFTYINPKKNYYCGSKVDIGNIQKAAQTYQGKFIIEFNELGSIKKQNLEDTKAYLTAEEDTFVPKFENFPVTMKRMYVFGGSTNDTDILYDTTGNRRFWCVECLGEFDKEMLLKIKDELWSEAYQAYLLNPTVPTWTLNEEERNMLDASNEKFQADDPLAAHMAEELSKLPESKISVNNVNAIARQYDRNAHPNTVKKIMTNILKWKSGRINHGTVRCYIKPDSCESNFGYN